MTIKKQLLIGFALAYSACLEAAMLKVCISGCTYSTIQAAIDAASDGDTIQVEAGQLFVESLRFPAKSDITVQSSRANELPPLEERIDPVLHADKLATVRAPNRFGTVMSVGYSESVVRQNGISVVNGTIEFDSRFGLGENVAVACWNGVPTPLVAREKYYIRDWNANTGSARLTTAPGGPAIDLLDAGSAGSAGYYVRPRCTAWDQPSGLTFRGIRFQAPANPGGDFGWLVNVGSNEQPAPAMGPNRIRFHQVVVSGEKDVQTGPSFCLVLAAGSGHEVVSSWIGHCKSIGSIESKGIWIQNANNVSIRNNYIMAASINILTAGGDAARGDVVRKLEIRGNLVEKAGYMMYREGAGAPTGECYYGAGSGAFYRRTDVPQTCADGSCYTCQPDGTWALNTGALHLASHYLTKNLIELKDCEDCIIEGNVFRGSYVGPDAGQGACASITAGTGPGFGSGYHRNYNVTFKNNWCDQVYGGLGVANGALDAAGFDQLPLRNINFENNLVTNLGRFPALSQWPTTSSAYVRNFIAGQGIDGLILKNNTFRVAPGSKARNAVSLGPGSWPPSNLITALSMKNNIFAFDGATGQCAFCFSFPPALAFNCTSDGLFLFVPSTAQKLISNNVFIGGTYNSNNEFVRSPSCLAAMFDKNEFVASESEARFVSSTNSRLASGSPFSAANVTPLVLAEEMTDIGVDLDLLESFVKPAEKGLPTMGEQLRLQIDRGLTQAVIRFRRPSNSPCQVRIYNHPARVQAHLIGDTQSSARQLDNRASSVVDGDAIQFLAGGVVQMEQGQRYQYHVDCGSLWTIGWFETLTTQTPEAENTTIIEPATTGEQGILEYSSSPDFSSTISLPAVTALNGKISLVVPKIANANYFRYRILNDQGVPRKNSTVRLRPAR